VLEVGSQLCRRNEAEPVTEAGERERDPESTKGAEAQDVADFALAGRLGRDIGQPADVRAGVVLATKLSDG
jgi:hypothetical protein